MAHIDVFNGDADGICALTQIRNAEQLDSNLVTGVKRDIQLLDRVEATVGDHVTVLDVSLDKNRDGLVRILDAGAEVFYCDHHFAGDIPTSDRLTALINTEPEVCTSILINGHLKGRFVEWAVVGAFGDNLGTSARKMAKPLGLDEATVERLENLGVYINYNGYGAAIEDLHFPPAELFEQVSRFANPLEFMNDAPETFEKLESGYRADMAAAEAIEPTQASDSTAVFLFPDAPWARRVSGVFSNDLVNSHPKRGHAVITERSDGTYLISVRAPLENRTGADDLCRRFPTGGGRKAAAGINNLPADMLDDFIAQFSAFYA